MQITMYGFPANVCQLCKYTEVRLNKYELEATKVMLDENPEAMEQIAPLGYGPGSRAPIVVVRDGDTVIDHWSGFQETKLEQLRKRVQAA